jgi:hypothetical protein
MIRFQDPIVVILIGFVMVVLGLVLPMLMVMQVLESTFFLNFLAYIFQFLGLVFGIIGSASYVSRRRKK